MKILLYAAFFLFSIVARAQVNEEQYIELFDFKLVDTTLSGTKDELFVKASSWMAKNYRSGKDVIQYSDKEAGKIIGKGYYVVRPGTVYTWNVEHLITIELKDGKMRATVNEMYLDGNYHGQIKYPRQSLDDEKPIGGMFGLPRGTWNKIKGRSYDAAINTLKDLKVYMHSDSSESDGFD